MRLVNLLGRIYFIFRLRRWLLMATTALVILTLLNLMVPQFWVTAPPTNRLNVGGQPVFWAGVNYPWKTGQDFGTGAWGHMGVSDPITYQEIDADFANMASNGVRIVKWRVFSDGRYGFTFNSEGYVTGLDEKFLEDLDAAVEIAARHDIYLVLVLFASGLWTIDCDSNGVQMGGHAASLLDPAKRRSFVRQGLLPMLRHLGDNDRVIAYETIAEPEWGVEELYHDEDGRIKVPLSVIRDFIKQMSDAIHDNTKALVTVESNRFSNMRYWQRLGLDYYTFSWYDWMEPYERLATHPRSAGLDRPIVLGEFPMNSSYYSMSDVMDTTYTLGYAGAFAWSFWSGDNSGNWQDTAPVFAAWTRNHLNEGDMGSVLLPSANAAEVQIRYPFVYEGLEVQPEETEVVMRLSINASSSDPYTVHAYLYEMGARQAVQDVTMIPSNAQPGKLSAHFTAVEEGKPYSVSLGIFDQDGNILKWFDNATKLTLTEGQITTPPPDPLLEEISCK